MKLLQNDPELIDWVSNLEAMRAGGFLRAIGLAAQRASPANYALIRLNQTHDESRKLPGALYCWPQPMGEDTFHYFRELVTGTTVGLWERDLTAAALRASMTAARARFGV